MQEKKFDESSRLDFVEIVRVARYASELFSFLVGLRTYQHPGKTLCIPDMVLNMRSIHITYMHMHCRLPNFRKKCLVYWRSLETILLSPVSGHSKFKTNRKQTLDKILLFFS